MNKMRLVLSSVLCFGVVANVASGEAYMEKFQAYQQWSQNLPTRAEPTLEFVSFIKEASPLSQKLREKWLYQLAREKSWATYTEYYQASEDTNLQCYALSALYHQGKEQQALQQIKPLWLNGSSQPPACNELFTLLLKSDRFNENLITQRIALALDKRNLSLAKYLLKQYKVPRLHDVQVLNDIYLNPTRITQLEPGELHDEFYLYGLKRLVSTNMDKAIHFWHHVKTKKLLSEKQQQLFLAHIALYKAMRNQKDAPVWFAKVHPEFYNDTLLDWQIRFALKQHQWKKVEHLIHHFQNKDNPSWQYWLARALEAQGQKEKALALYQELAKARQYYGFLASRKLNQSFSFEHELPATDMKILEPYQAFLEQVKSLYLSNQTLQASRLLNDFVLELPKDEKSALVYWLAQELQWYGKAVNLSNSDELNNQLSLRFPLAYHNTITQYAKNYNIPQELVYAIIRQESTFREDVVSPVGAHGLMQLMPATAQMTAKREHIPFADKKELFSTQKNINLGIAYLQQLYKRFGEHPLLVAAAYNAGPKQVAYWLKNHSSQPIDIWIETLPWHETRNYLKNVIAFYAVYQYRLQETPDLSAFMKPF